MSQAFYVYALIDPRTNLPFYIGKGKGNRCYKHLKETKDDTENYKKWAYIQGLRNKGLEPLVTKLYEELDENTAYYLEEVLIWKYGRKGYDENGILTNICESNRPPSLKGVKKRPLSDETKQKISDTKKNNHIVYSQEYLENLSIKRKGSNNPFYGKKHKKETKVLMKEKRHQRIENGVIEGMTNKKHTIATKDLLKEKQIEKFANTDFIEKHLESMAVCYKSYKVITPTGEEMIINGLSKFARDNDLPLPNIRAVVNRRKNGYDTKYKGWIIEVIE